MGALVFIIVLVVLAVIFCFVAIKAQPASARDDVPVKGIAAFLAVVLGIGAVVAYVSTSVNSVPANEVGIVASFGAPQGTVGTGLHWLAPWQEVETFDTHMQTLDLAAQNNPFKFSTGTGGSVEITVNWNVDQKDAVNMWRKYTTLAHVRDQLLTPRVKNAVVEVYAEYTPENAVGKQAEIGQKVAQKLHDDLQGDGVNIDPKNVTLKNFALDANTQDRINSITNANTDLQKASIAQQQAKIDAATNQIRQQSLTPQALQSQCYSLMQNWDVQKQGTMPATFNCSSSGTAGVILNAGK